MSCQQSNNGLYEMVYALGCSVAENTQAIDIDYIRARARNLAISTIRNLDISPDSEDGAMLILAAEQAAADTMSYSTRVDDFHSGIVPLYH